MKKQLPAWMVLLVITLIAGLALGATYTVTKDTIADQATAAAANARQSALPVADAFEAVTLEEGSGLDWLYRGDKDGEAVGYVGQITVQGFGGPVEVIAGLDNELTVTGISVGGSDFSETAGLGAKSKEPAFQKQFAGKVTPLSVIKAGGTPGDNTIDAITSATITSSAVTNGVNKIASYLEPVLFPEGRAGAVTMPEKPEGAQVYGASAKGFGGPVWVDVCFDGNGAITYLSVGNDEFAETDGIGSRTKEHAFQIQFIGKTAPVAESDVDLLAGATISSRAVISAINKAYDQASGAPVATEAPAPVLPEVDMATAVGASSKGFGGPVWVDVNFDADGKITALSIGNDKFAETDGIGSRVPEDADFISQFIGMQAPVNAEDIDVVSGATVTSTAVINAVNKAYEKAVGGEEEAAPAEEPEETDAAALPAVDPATAYGASSKGFGGPVWVDVNFDESGKITALSIGNDKFAETDGIGSRVPGDADFISQFIGMQAPVNEEDIDVVSGATVTSNAVISAVNKAYEKAVGGGEEEVPAEEAPVALPTVDPATAYGASSKGFGGPVWVDVNFDADGKITALSIGNDKFAETDGIGSRVPEDADFISQFIGMQAPVNAEDIDVVSGATVTSTAVINAVNKAYEKAVGGEEEAAPAEEPEEADAAALPAVDPATAYGASSKGFGGPVWVDVNFDADGKITALSIGNDKFAETDGIGSRVPEDADFISQFIGMQAPVNEEDIDVVSGATVTSTAVINAVNKAYEKAAGGEEDTAPAEEAAEEADAAALPAVDPATAYGASSKGFGGPVWVDVNFDADGKITALSIGNDKFAETDGIGSRVPGDADFISQFIGMQAPVNAEDIDVVSGATVTSTAVINAVNKAYDKMTAGAQ